MTFINPFETKGNWYKANLHCHTTKSDGKMTPAERVEQYKKNGYSVLAITDHNAVTDVSGLSSPDFLVVQSVELHPPDGDSLHHIVALNMPLGFSMADGEDALKLMKRVKDAGGIAFLAHPNWLGQDANSLMQYTDSLGIEVYNSTCARMAKPLSSVQWDDMLQRGARIVAIAVDDAHTEEEEVFDGWVWLKMPGLTSTAVIQALKTGCFYSSTGPEIKDINICDGIMKVECSPVKHISFVADRWNGIRISAKKGEELTHAELPIPQSAKYIRIECTDIYGKTAWSNPFFF
mgnify:CR=1 FL=1